MYFSYVPSIIFSFFNRPFFLNLLFKQILIHYYILLLLLVFICVLSAAAPGAAVARVRREDVALRVVRDVGGNLRGELDLYHRALRVDREAGVDGLREVRDELAGADVPRPGLRAEGLLHVPGHRVRRGRVVDLS